MEPERSLPQEFLFKILFRITGIKLLLPLTIPRSLRGKAMQYTGKQAPTLIFSFFLNNETRTLTLRLSTFINKHVKRNLLIIL